MILKKIYKNNRFVIILLLVAFVLRLPSLFEPYWYGDESIYLTLGMGLKKGLLLYRDIFDNKPPLIYAIAAIANGRLFWFRLLLLISTLLSTFFFYKLSKKMFVKNSAVKVSAIFFALFTTIRLFEGNIANSEIFILLPTVFSFYLLWPSVEEKSKKTSYRYLLGGVILSFGFLLKVPAVFDFLSLFLIIYFFSDQKLKLSSLLKKNYLYFLAGYLTPIALTGFYFFLRGAFYDFFSSCILQTFGYLSSWKTGSHAFSILSLFKTDLFLKSSLILIIFIAFWLKRRQLNKLSAAIFIWFILSLFGATLSGRPYPHYLMQVVPSLSLTFGLIFVNKNRLFLITLTFLFFLAAFVHYRFWTYTTLSYYQNFLQFALKIRNKTAYYSYFNNQVLTNYKIAEVVSAYSRPDEKIFVWADEPSLYPLSGRLPSTPYTVAYHIIDLKLYAKVEKLLLEKPPAVIVYQQNLSRFPFLESLIRGRYLQVATVNNFDIYRLGLK